MTILLLSLISSLGYSQASCEPPPINNTVSINVSFADYQYENDLPGVLVDAKIMDRFSSIVSNNVNKLTSNDRETVSSKENFLNYLRRATANKEYVNFNYAGHGIRMGDSGGWAIILPGMPRGCVVEVGYRNFVLEEQNKERCERYIVRDSEMSDVFKDKKVFGIIDSCQSGALKPGAKESYFVSAQGDQLANDSGGGVLFKVVKNILDRKNICSLDQNENGRITLAEMYNNLPVVAFGTGNFYESSDMEKMMSEAKGENHLSSFSCDYYCSNRNVHRGLGAVSPCDCEENKTRGLGAVKNRISREGQEQSYTAIYDWQECYTMLSSRSCPKRTYRTVRLKSEIDLLGANNKIVCSLGRGSEISPIYALQNGAVKYKVVSARSTITSSAKCADNIEGYGIPLDYQGYPLREVRYFNRPESAVEASQ